MKWTIPDRAFDNRHRPLISAMKVLGAALISTMLLNACSKGGEGDGAEEGISVSGTLFTASKIVVDHDINDREGGTRSNDDPFDAQVIPNIVTVQGFASAAPTGAEATEDANLERFAETTDRSDYYAVSLQAGQRVVMNVVDYEDNDNPDSVYSGDLDLFLYPSTGRQPLKSSQTETNTEEFTVDLPGDYILEVYAHSGISKYVLQILPARNGLLSTRIEGNTFIKNTSSDEKVTVDNTSNSLTRSFVPREAIVRWKDSSTASASGYGIASAVVTFDYPVKVTLEQPAKIQSLSASGRDMSAFTDGRDTLSAIKTLGQRDDVEYAEPNYIRKALISPNDSLYRQQFHYADIRLPQAWDLSTGSRNVIVAVIDTGVFLDHDDLNNKLTLGYDFISDTAISRDGDGIDSNPDDPGDSNQRGASSWHGTHVSGTVAAATNNRRGTAGAGWDTRVMPLRVLGLNGEGTTYDVIQAIRYAAQLSNDSRSVPDERADIINLSLGSNFSSRAEQDSIRAARNQGVIIVAAAGNSGTDEDSYPASYDGVISVSATAPDNSLAYYSNFGRNIDVAAPGGDMRFDTNVDGQADGVLSTSVDDSSGSRTSAYTLQQGTSMATPHVAGVLALMRAVDPTLTPDEVDSLLVNGLITDDIGPTGRDDSFGYGLINALKAVQEANNLAGGGQIQPTPILESDPSELQFDDRSSLTLVVDNVNDEADDPVITMSKSDDWISVNASNVDANGLGEYRVTIDRTDLVDGIYEGTVRFTPDTGNSLDIPVTMRVGDAVAVADAAPQYVLLENVDTREIVKSILASEDGTYTITGIEPGDYRVIAGSDIDVDLFICQNGETCGGYPDTVSEEILNINEDLSGIDFVVSLVSGISVSDGDDDGDTLGILRSIPNKERELTLEARTDEGSGKPRKAVAQ